MEFVKYRSMNNFIHTNVIDDLIRRKGNEECIVEEKIDGSNYSFIVNRDGEVESANRYGLTRDNEDYFASHVIIFEKYKNSALKMAKELLAKYSQYDYVQMYGEFFGGSYSHKDVKPIKGISKVQGANYYNDLGFMLFDTILFNKDKTDRIFINQDEFKELAIRSGFDVARTLFRGTLRDCLKCEENFETTIPELYNLPKIEHNAAEGLVIKQVASVPLSERIIVKKKSEKYNEIKKALKRERNMTLKQISVTSEYLEVLSFVDSCINEQRFNSARSKIGEFSDNPRTVGLYMKEMSLDILNEIYDDADISEIYNSLELDASASIRKAISKHVGKFLSEKRQSQLEK